jgi:hypothetical protein
MGTHTTGTSGKVENVYAPATVPQRHVLELTPEGSGLGVTIKISMIMPQGVSFFDNGFGMTMVASTPPATMQPSCTPMAEEPRW